MKRLLKITLISVMVLNAQNIFAKIIIDNANYQSKIIKLNSTKNPKITRAWVETEFKEEKNRSTVLYEIALYTTNFTEPLSYQDSAFLKLPKFP